MISLTPEHKLVEVFDSEFERIISGPKKEPHYKQCKKFYDLTYEYLDFQIVWCAGLHRVLIAYKQAQIEIDCYSGYVQINRFSTKPIVYSENFIQDLIFELDKHI